MQHGVTDASISSNKQGAGILIRKIRLKKEINQKINAKTANTEKQGDNLTNSTAAENISKNDEAFINSSLFSDSSTRINDREDAGNNSGDNKNNHLAEHNEGDDRMSLKPRPGDVCVIHYDCYIEDMNGKLELVDSTREQPNQNSQHLSIISDKKQRLPLKFEIGKGDVIRGLEVAVQRMIPSSTYSKSLSNTIDEGEDYIVLYEVTIPHLYAYGHEGHLPEIPPRSNLVFLVELIEVQYKHRCSERHWWWKNVLSFFGR